MVSVRLMNEEEYQYYYFKSSEDYARESPHYVGMAFEDALATVRKDYDTIYVPQGLKTPGAVLLAILQDDQNIGWLHVGEKPLGSKNLYAYNFEIKEELRGQGIGSEVMRLAGEFLKAKGYERMTLNVFADNLKAKKLYDSFGFKVTQMNMSREL